MDRYLEQREGIVIDKGYIDLLSENHRCYLVAGAIILKTKTKKPPQNPGDRMRMQTPNSSSQDSNLQGREVVWESHFHFQLLGWF